MVIAVSILAGLAAGILSGLLGVGGGIVLVPMMVFILGVSQHIAQGVSLLVIIPTAASGLWHLHKEKLVDYKTAALLSLGAIAGAMLSANFVQSLPAAELKKIFGVFVIIMGGRMIFAKPRAKAENK
ncbi:MAG: sulfite exporter TauE/SafE family protein [Veillonellaceae bacterium]|nr:sulfite exporter TauE/SafE family protein [Veillonellaceae bacterium]